MGVDVGHVTVAQVNGLALRLNEFVKPFQEAMGFPVQERHLGAFVGGLLGGTERKSVEPIALAQGVSRRQLQHFVGVSVWDHRPLIEVLQSEVAAELGDSEGILVIDGSAIPKKGTESVGVTRQWCGRLGKVENCQVGVFLAYAGKGSCTLVDERLFLPRCWAEDAERRHKGKVPEEVEYRTSWHLADEMVRRTGPRLPHRWVTGDSEFGRASAFRDSLAKRGERYIMEVPVNVVVRTAARKKGRTPRWHAAKQYLRRWPVTAWQRFTVRDGQKEPIEVIALAAEVQTRRRRRGKRELLVAVEALSGSDKWYFLSNAPTSTPLDELVGAAMRRHLIEERFEAAKGETGLDHYEVRSWLGWHHHMASSLVALWFLVKEQRRLGQDGPALGGDGALHLERAASPPPLAS